MYKKLKEVERNYQLINKIINSTCSHLIKKFLLDNIITIVTKHDNEASTLFYSYLKKELINNKNKSILINRQSQNRFSGKNTKIIRYLWFGIRFILKPKKIWNRINLNDKNIILIYVPNPKYLDLAIPIYEEIKNSLDLTPVLLYYWKEGKLCKNNYKQINLYDYSINLNKLFILLKEVITIKKCINKEKIHQDFYDNIYKLLWKSQIINLIIEEIAYGLFKKNSNIKALFSCLPTSDCSRILSSMAEKFNIPTFSIRRGVTDYNLELKFINTKYILAKGEQEKEIYIKMGFVENRINVVGAPFLKEKIINKPIINSQINIFYVDQPLTQSCNMNCKRKIINCIGKILRNYHNLKLIIKLHPMSKYHEKIYIEEFQRIGFMNYIIYKSNYDLNKVLDISDYVIMYNSTVGFNVLLMNKPLIVLSNSFLDEDITNVNGEHLFFDERIAFTIKNVWDLQDIFMHISEGKIKRKKYEDIKSFLEYYIKYTGDAATKHIVKFIESKIQESKMEA